MKLSSGTSSSAGLGRNVCWSSDCAVMADPIFEKTNRHLAFLQLREGQPPGPPFPNWLARAAVLEAPPPDLVRVVEPRHTRSRHDLPASVYTSYRADWAPGQMRRASRSAMQAAPRSCAGSLCKTRPVTHGFMYTNP